MVGQQADRQVDQCRRGFPTDLPMVGPDEIHNAKCSAVVSLPICLW